MADLFVTSGLEDAGYEYINLDDCWALPQRDADGDLVPDPVQFPNGIAAALHDDARRAEGDRATTRRPPTGR